MGNLSRFFIDRPIFASVVSIVIVIMGAVAFLRLPVAQYPEIVPPVITTPFAIVFALRSRIPAVRRTVPVPKAALAPACRVPTLIVVSPE